MRREYLGNEGFPGWEYLEEIRYNERYQEVLVGAVTNNKDKGFAALAMRSGEEGLRDELIRRIKDVESV